AHQPLLQHSPQCHRPAGQAEDDPHKAFRWVQEWSCSEYAGVMQYAGVHGGGSPRMEQIAIMGAYNVGQAKNIAKRLAGIQIDEPYTYDRLGSVPGLDSLEG
ncbi:MAG: hypothetical protein KAQ74_03530, partial [Dehalococcoidia bacterium]|nr:hypothetical protein [Dehalococcoidia bacterium]